MLELVKGGLFYANASRSVVPPESYLFVSITIAAVFAFLCRNLHLGRATVRWQILGCGVAFLILSLFRFAIGSDIPIVRGGSWSYGIRDWQIAVRCIHLVDLVLAIYLVVQASRRDVSEFVISGMSKAVRERARNPVARESSSQGMERPLAEPKRRATYENIVMGYLAATLAIIYFVWIYPVLRGISLAKAKGISPQWMWFGLHPLGAWIVFLVLRSAAGRPA